MSPLFVQLVAAIITATLAIHLIAVSIQIGTAVTDGIRSRVVPDVPLLAALWQNVGIGMALAGFLQRDTQLIVFGGLFIGLRLMLQPLAVPSWNAKLEQPLLVMAAASMGLLAVLHGLHQLAD
jgi:hypothetical protein